MKIILFISVLVFTMACTESINYDEIATFDSDEVVNAVIEIPAGTNKKIEYSHDEHAFVQDQREGKKRVIHFLSYPGNYGFIPNTISKTANGGDGDPIDVLVLSESVETSTVLKVEIIGGIGLIDEGEIDTKLIAVPAQVEDRTLNFTDISDLEKHNPAIVKMICDWFINYDRSEDTFVKSILSKEEALEELKANLRK